MWASLFRRITDTNVYGSVKIQKTRHEISADRRIFLTVYDDAADVGGRMRGPDAVMRREFGFRRNGIRSRSGSTLMRLDAARYNGRVMLPGQQ